MTAQEISAKPLSFSKMKLYLLSPAHYKYAIDFPEEKEDTEALLIGKALHCMVLEPERFRKDFDYLDLSKRPSPEQTFAAKINKEWKLAEMLKMGNKTVLSKDQFDKVTVMADKVTCNAAAMKILDGCQHEQHIEWTDPCGVKCHGFVDAFNPNKTYPLVGELKSIADGSPWAFNKYLDTYSVYMQMAFYSDGLQANYDKEFSVHFAITIENCAPWLCQPYYLQDSDIDFGRKLYKAILALHMDCIEKDHWGGYEEMCDPRNYKNGIIYSQLPEYLQYRYYNLLNR